MATAATTAQRRPWAGIELVYSAGLLQGLVLVSFPASSAVLKELQGLSDAQYGAIFLPQVAFAVLGSIGGGSLARGLGLKTLLVLALACNVLAQALLAGSATGGAAAFPLVMAATGAAGLAFGLHGAPLNAFPPQFFPERRDTAVVAIHSLLGLGAAGGPLLVAPFVAADRWVGFPIALGVLNLLVLCALLPVGLRRRTAAELTGTSGVTGGSGRGGPSRAVSERPPLGARLFWLFVAIAVLYAVAEGTFANWAVIYMYEGLAVPQATAGLAIAVFWGALVAGRLATSALVLRVPAQAIWLGLLVLMVVAFLSLPLAVGAATGIALFGLAGLACSAVFPLTITLVSRAFPGQVEWVSSMMIAALMAGVGLGSFIFGPLREVLSFDQLYRISALYPAATLLLAAIVARSGACRQAVRAMWKGSRCQ